MVELFASHGALLESWLPEPLIRSLRHSHPPPEALAEASALLHAACARLAPFAPSLVVHTLDDGPAAGQRIAGQYLTGAILTAEVVGLAALTSRLAEGGLRGVESAGAVVSRLLGAMFGAIEAHGGGVVKSGGDSLIAFFDARRLGESFALHALAAALELREAAARLADSPGGERSLRLRVAVHTGRVLAVEVGDATHAELLVTGHAISRVGRALLGAAPGEVIVTDKLLQLAPGADAPLKVSGQHILRGLAELPGAPRSTRPRAMPHDLAALVERLARLQPYAPTGLPGRLSSATVGSGEFRPVTALMANFCAFNRLLDLLELPALIESDPTIVGQVLNTYYTRIQAVIQRYGGVVSRFDLAPYGDRFVALFGAPTAHEDDPARAVQTALSVRNELSETTQAITSLLREWAAAHPDQQRLVYLMSVTVRQRVGIASGSAFAGIVGAPSRHEYAVIGQPMQLAARLMAGAEDSETLLSEETCRAVSHLVALEPRPGARVDSGAQPVFRAVQPRFEAAQPPRQLWRTAPLIGRDAELALALELAQQALVPAGGGHILRLVGAPGVGKSRLADELLRALRGRMPSATLVYETCQSYDEQVPYAALARLLRRLLYVPATADRAAQARAVQAQLGELLPGWLRFAPLLGPLLSLPLEETDVTRALGSDQRRERLHELVAMLCLALARRQPLVLLIDDLQWADASTQTALLRIAEEIPGRPILLVLMHRPSPALSETWPEQPGATQIELGDLEQEHSELLLATLLDGRLPDELRPLVERAHGTPLFIEETVRFLLDSGALARDGAGEWFCTRSVQGTVVPSQIEQILVARLDQLGADERSVLEVAAVIGRRFGERLLSEVTGGEHDTSGAKANGNGHAAAGALRTWRDMRGTPLRETLEALVHADILQPDETAIEPAYSFRHALIRDVTYGSILFARRHQLHAQVAETIERIAGAELDDQRVVLAQHYLHAGQSERAFPHLVLAGERAQARYATSEALALYRQALAIAPQEDQATERLLPQTALLYERIGDLLALTADYGAARVNYEWLLRMGVADEGQSRGLRKAALQRKIGGTHEQQGSLDLALSWFERAADTIAGCAGDAASDAEHARVLSDIGWFHYRRDELDEAQQFLERSLAVLEPHEAHAELARLLNRLGGVAWSRGAIDEALVYVERSRAASERSGDLLGQANALNNLGVLTAGSGQSAEAVQHGLRALELYEQVGNRRMVAVTAINVGHATYDLGDFAGAATLFGQALALAAAVRDQYHQMVAHLGLGLAHLATEAASEAELAIGRSRELAVTLNLPAEQIDACTALGEIALLRGLTEVALGHWRAARTLDVDEESAEYGRLERLEARIAIAQGDRERAAGLLQAAAERFTRLNNVPEARRTRLLLDELQLSAREHA